MRQQKDSYRWWVLVTVSIGSVMASLDISVTTTCLPQLADVFHTDPSVVGWVTIIYFIVNQSLALSISRVGDARGRKKIYIIGLAFYMAGLLAVSLSQTVAQLISARAIQGVGAAAAGGLGVAISIATFPAEERGKALGILTGAASVGLLAGPVFGGFALDFLGWRGIFYTRIPFIAAGLVMAWLIIVEQKGEEKQPFRFDTVGAVSLLGWLSGLLLFLSFVNKWGLASGPGLLLSGMTVFFFVVFISAERRSTIPIVDLGLFRSRLFATATLSSVFMTVGSSSVVFLLPFYLMQGLGSSGATVGTYMTLCALPSVVLSPLAGRASDRIGSRFLSTVSVVIVCTGIFWLSRLGLKAGPVGIGAGCLLVGSAIGIFHPPNSNALFGSVPKDMLGVASAIATSARTIGSSIAFAVSGAVYSMRTSHHLTRLKEGGLDLTAAAREASVASFHDTLMVVLCIAAFGILTSLVRGSARGK